MTTMTEPTLLVRPGFAISFGGHVAVVAVGLIYAGANPFESVPAAPITVDIVSPDEIVRPADDSEPPETTAASASLPSAAAAPQTAAATEPSIPPTSEPMRQESAPPQSPMLPSATPWQTLQPEGLHQPNAADMFAMPLTMPDGTLGGGFDGPAIDKANVANDDIAKFHKHLKSCSALPAEIARSDNVKAVLRVHLRPDGMLAEDPTPIRIEGVSRGGGALYQSAVAALRKCQPYNMLPRDRYQEWKVFDLSFTPENFGRE